MLQLATSVCEGCEEFSFSDNTGLYNLLTNPDGYGAENGVFGPAYFDTYELHVRYPGTAITDPADFVYNLKFSVPDPDDDYHFTWVITQADMGLTTMAPGQWTFTAIGILSGVTYTSDAQCIFIRTLEAMVDEAMADYDPSCPCKSGCENPALLFAEFLTIKCGGICDGDKAQAAINSLVSRLPLCC